MQLPNLLASRAGRLMAFFLLYVTEGIPLGFTSTTMAVQMKRGGLSEQEIGIFVGSLYLPWAWKWVIGPFVDLFYSNRLGARRGWILGAQVMMILTLIACMPIELSRDNLSLITLLIMAHNMFCAIQDVAIDALACTVLQEDQRGLANGLMAAGQTLGIPLGGACVLYLIEGVDISWLPALRDGIPVQSAYWFVVGCILMSTIFVVLPLREEPRIRPVRSGSRLKAAASELRDYGRLALKSFFGSRVAFCAMLFALLPPGSIALNLALQKTLAVEVGFTNGDIANLEIKASILWALMGVLGGVISDRLGHLKSLAIFIILISVPTFWCAHRLEQEGVTLPKRVTVEHTESDAPLEAVENGRAEPETERNRTAVKDQATASENDPSGSVESRARSIFRKENSPAMANSFWWAVMAYMACQGLMSGARIAVFMRIANPDVAATQFTAYMAMMNLVLAYSSSWQGYTITKYGYPTTLYIDGVFGLLCLVILPMLRERRESS